MEYIKNNAFSILTAIPVVFVAVGALIININLGRYGVIDFPVFDSRTVYVGFIGLLQILGYSLLWLLFISWNGQTKEVPILIVNTIWKPALMASIVWQYGIDYSSIKDFSYGAWDFDVSKLISQSSTMSLGFLVIFSGKQYWRNGLRKDPLGVISLSIGAIMILAAMRGVVMIVLFVPELRNVFLSYFYASLGFFVFTMTRWGINNDARRGIEFIPTFPFEKDSILKLLNPYFYLVIGVIFALFFLFNYSTMVYPYCNLNAGGGKYAFARLELKDKTTVKGQIIHSNTSYIYILDSTNSVTQFSMEEIRRYSLK